MTNFKGLPRAAHPLFSPVYGNYAEAYNRLAEALIDAGIDIQLLIDLTGATEQLERLSMIHCLEALVKHLNNTGDLSVGLIS